MNRTKLQQLVRDAVSTNTPSTEGFLGDVMSSIKVGLGLKRRPILSDREARKESVGRYTAVGRLKKTVLNDKWLSSATFIEGELPLEYSQRLQFPGSQNNNDLLGSLKIGSKELSKFDDLYAECVREHVIKVVKILDKLSLAVNLDDDDADYSHYADVACDELAALENPTHLVGNVTLNMFGNQIIQISKGQVTVKPVNSPVVKLKLLDKEQVKIVAQYLIEFIDNGELFPRVDDQVSEYLIGFDYNLMEALEDTDLHRKYLANNFEECWYIDQVFKHDQQIIFALLSWLNASVK